MHGKEQQPTPHTLLTAALAVGLACSIGLSWDQAREIKALRADNHANSQAAAECERIAGLTANGAITFHLQDGSTFVLSDPDDQCTDSDTPDGVRNSAACQ